METQSTELAVQVHPQRLDKKVRIRPCLGKLRVPTSSGRSEIVFDCQEDKHGPETPHRHTGLIWMDNETCRQFTITWVDLGTTKLYRHTKRTKEYRLAQRAAKKAKENA